MKRFRPRRSQIRHAERLEDRHLMAVDLLAVSPGALNRPTDVSARAVDVDANLELTFSEPVVKGSGFVEIRHHSDNRLVEAIDVNSSQVQVSGSTVTVDPAGLLPQDASLYIYVGPTVFQGTGEGTTRAVLLSEDFDRLELENSFLDTPLDDYLVVVRGELDVVEAGPYSFGVHGRDGQYLAIDTDRNGLTDDDVLIRDNARHTDAQDRIHTCGVSTLATACEGNGSAPAILLDTGRYAFEYHFFDRSGQASGEVFYAPGHHESWNDQFALVGDASQGIAAPVMKGTIWKAPEGTSLIDLDTAQALIQDEFVVVALPIAGEGGQVSSGREASFRVGRSGTEYSVSLVNPGTGYAEGDQLLILGDFVGGERGPAEEGGNNLVLSVQAVNALGGIESFGFEGVAVDPLACPTGPGSESACLTTLNIAEEGSDGRYSGDARIESSWQLANDNSLENWTGDAPTGWSREQTQLETLRPEGPEEYTGWTFLDQDFWVNERGDNQRSLFTRGDDIVAVVDPNGFHQGASVDATGNQFDCLNSGTPEDCGFFSGSLSTPRIGLGGAVENTAMVTFDSSWWNEDTQSAEIWADYYDSAGSLLRSDRVVRWDSQFTSPHYKPVFDFLTGIDTRNEEVELSLNNPAEASSVQLTFRMPHAQNDWWWAIDNVQVSAEVQGGAFFSGIENPGTWRFMTRPSVRFATTTLSVPETAGEVVIDVARSPDAENPWSFAVDYEITAETATLGEVGENGEITDGDFVGATASTLTYSSLLESELSQSLLVIIVDDDLAEGNETLRITLSPAAEALAVAADLPVPELILTIVDDDQVALPGDFTGDGAVGFIDFLIFSENFGKTVPVGQNGDLTGDGEVGFIDFLIFSENFGRQLAPSAAEPVAASPHDQVMAEWVALDSLSDDDDAAEDRLA